MAETATPIPSLHPASPNHPTQLFFSLLDRLTAKQPCIVFLFRPPNTDMSLNRCLRRSCHIVFWRFHIISLMDGTWRRLNLFTLLAVMGGLPHKHWAIVQQLAGSLEERAQTSSATEGRRSKTVVTGSLLVHNPPLWHQAFISVRGSSLPQSASVRQRTHLCISSTATNSLAYHGSPCALPIFCIYIYIYYYYYYFFFFLGGGGEIGIDTNRCISGWQTADPVLLNTTYRQCFKFTLTNVCNINQRCCRQLRALYYLIASSWGVE